MLTQEKIDQAAALLTQARIENKVIDCIPENIRPNSLAEAYAVQDQFIKMLSLPIGGWFGACTNETIQSMLGLYEPYYARLLSDYIFNSPAVLESCNFPPIALEVEYGFKLNKDLPNRSVIYTREEIEDSVESVHPTIEVVAAHLKNWTEQDVYSVIADNGTDGALIVGDGVTEWQTIDMKISPVALSINGSILRTGSGVKVMGDPMECLV
jgi:2-keto-4-pentenoate hydratase